MGEDCCIQALVRLLFVMAIKAVILCNVLFAFSELLIARTAQSQFRIIYKRVKKCGILKQLKTALKSLSFNPSILPLRSANISWVKVVPSLIMSKYIL